MTEAALIAEYRPLALAIASDYFLPGAEPDDVRQEALLALLIAIRSYSPAYGVSLKGFARLVIKRRLVAALRMATRSKHGPLNHAAPIEAAFLAPLAGRDAFETLVLRDRLRRIVEAAASLSPLERRALGLSLDGIPFSHDKALENANWRARRKLKAAA